MVTWLLKEESDDTRVSMRAAGAVGLAVGSSQVGQGSSSMEQPKLASQTRSSCLQH